MSKINQLEAMELATTAWNRVMPSTVSVTELQQSLDALHAQNSFVLVGNPMRAEEFLAADADAPTEQILSDDEIVDEVKRQMDADVESRELSLEDDETVHKTASLTSSPMHPTQTRDDALKSLEGLRNFITGLNMPDFGSDLAALV
ncbi:hypothetical protein RhiLY_12362 [Ceratobasidium sp. AG-Ba]|nr:hypothetical protein RhiLY_12362 [Ceratobasidium sp. AG-Ba]